MINHNISLEVAKSNASICKSCKEKIKKDTTKVIIKGGVGFGGYPINFSLCRICGKAHLVRFCREMEDMIKKIEGEINENNRIIQ
jgi:hypothetical protein